MEVNFKIADTYALKLNGIHLDLHSDFNFDAFNYSVTAKCFEMRWVRSAGDWVKADTPAIIVLVVAEVDYLLIMPQEHHSPATDDSCVMDITFSPLSERQNNEHIFPQEAPNEDDDLLLIFQNGQIIRVHGSAIHCRVS